MKKKTLGLIPKIIIAIALGIVVGRFLPDWMTRVSVTFSTMFGAFLNFIIPLMILAFVSKGIADLSEGAGKLLLVTVILSYCSTLIAGSLSYVMSSNIFPSFITPDLVQKIQEASSKTLDPYFTIPLGPIIEVTNALVFAFMLGLCVSVLRLSLIHI